MRVSIDDMLSHGDMGVGHRAPRHPRNLPHVRATTAAGSIGCSEAIDNGLTAEAAVERVQNDTRARMLRSTDPYIRDRLHDFDDLANRLLRVADRRRHRHRHAASCPRTPFWWPATWARRELLEYDRTRLRAIVLEEGGATAHVAIVAKSLGMVAVGQAENIVSIWRESATTSSSMVPAGTGAPAADAPTLEQTYVDKVRISAKRRAHYLELKDKPSITRDGVAITLLHNSGLVADLPMLRRHRRRGRGAVPHRAAVHDRLATCPRLQRAGRALSPRPSGSAKASPSSSACSISAATR